MNKKTWEKKQTFFNFKAFLKFFKYLHKLGPCRNNSNLTFL